MDETYELSYTAEEVDQLLHKVDSMEDVTNEQIETLILQVKQGLDSNNVQEG